MFSFSPCTDAYYCLAMTLGSSSRASKHLPMPWSPHMAMSQSRAISSSVQPAFCHALTSGQ